MENIKYTIHGFQQLKLIELKLTNDDALILKIIKDSYSSSAFEHIIHKNDKYIWINHSKLLSYIPIIGSKSTLERRIKYFSEIGLIEKILMYEKNGQKGSYSYMKPTKILDSLTEYEFDTLCQNDIGGYVKMTKGVCQNDIEGMSKRHNKDSINLDSINLDSINISLSEQNSDNKQTKINVEIIDNLPSINFAKNIFDNDSIEIKLSKYLFEKMQENNKKAKQPNFNTWAKSIELMIRLDKRTEDEIKNVINFCQKDSFWKTVILSTSKLRDKFDTLWLKMQEPPKVKYNNIAKPIQATNYNQREYEDEFFEGLYTDLSQYKKA